MARAAARAIDWAVGEVERHGHDACVVAHGAGLAGEGVHLAGAALEQCVDQATAQAAVGAGDDWDSGGQIHGESLLGRVGERLSPYV